MKQTLWLPWPPTANTMFGLKGHHRFVSKSYAKWKDEASAHILMQRSLVMDGCVAITIALTPPDKRRRDIDNHVKPVLDILVTHKIIEDDNLEIVRRITVEVAQDAHPGAQVTVEAI